MKNVLEIYTFHSGYKGGIATMVQAYLDGKNEFADYGYTIAHLNIPSKFQTGFSKLDNFFYIFTQRRYVKECLGHKNYDLIHIHTSREFLFLKDVLLAKMINKEFHKPVVITIHVGAIGTVYNRIHWFMNKSIAILNKYVSKTIFLSAAMREDFVKAGLRKQATAVLYNFHNIIPTNNNKKKEYLQLLYVGSIHREKGILELLHAIEQLPNMKCHLNVCGLLTDKAIEGEVESLKNRLVGRVSFHGYVSGNAKMELFNQSDILILPSYHEGLPLVIMEALGAGCAIITTKVGAIPEVLSDENVSWIRIASIEDIVRGLQDADRNRQALHNQMRHNKEKGKLYSFRTHVAKLSNIYKDII